MVDSFNAYPKIWHFGHPNTRQLVGTPVRVEEKVDGSQFSFGVFENEHGVPELRCRSRRVEMNPEAPTDLFALACSTALLLAREQQLTVGWTYRGEAFKSPKHNTLTYGRIPTGGVILYDIAMGINDYASRMVVDLEAARLGLETVPLLGRAETFTTYEQVEELLDRESVLGGVKIEGVVLKPEQPLFGDDGKPMYAKVVSADFKELHSKNPEFKTTRQRDAVTEIAAAVSTIPRWRKVVQHGREAGKLVGDPRDLQYLIKDLQQDILDECEEEIKGRLFASFKKKILGAAVKGFPEWYKEQLMREVFDENHDS